MGRKPCCVDPVAEPPVAATAFVSEKSVPSGRLSEPMSDALHATVSFVEGRKTTDEVPFPNRQCVTSSKSRPLS